MTDKPKRPMTAYMIWYNSVREQIKAENHGIKVTEIAIKAGEIWRSMKDKSVWEAKAVKAKEQYAEDLATYNAKGDGRYKKGKKTAPSTSERYSEDSNDDEESDD